MWQWLREQGIVPYFEIITPQANASLNKWLFVEPPELETFFKTIADLDCKLFGQTWDIQPPLVGQLQGRCPGMCRRNIALGQYPATHAGSYPIAK